MLVHSFTFDFRLYLLLGKYESNMIALKLEVETSEEIMNCYSSLLSIYDGSANEEEKKYFVIFKIRV